MNGEGLGYLGSQLVFQLPTVLVLLVAIFVSVFQLGRARVPALLTLAGAITWMASSLVAAVVQAHFLSRANSGDMRHEEVGVALQAFGVANSIVHAVCMALFVIAIFVGRRRPDTAAV